MLINRNSKLMQIFVNVLVTHACICLQTFQRAISKRNARIGWSHTFLIKNPETFSVQILRRAANWNPISGILNHAPQEVAFIFIFSSSETETCTLSIRRNRLGLTLSIRSEFHPKVSPKLFPGGGGGGQYHPHPSGVGVCLGGGVLSGVDKPWPCLWQKIGFFNSQAC